ncbi:hypothetical protein M0802_013980 [Mischocyttarus mexicanus]|nr:hypothetical protein M0802_013980 [Mischocyttarus mexicanus]
MVIFNINVRISTVVETLGKPHEEDNKREEAYDGKNIINNNKAIFKTDAEVTEDEVVNNVKIDSNPRSSHH